MCGRQITGDRAQPVCVRREGRPGFRASHTAAPELERARVRWWCTRRPAEAMAEEAPAPARRPEEGERRRRHERAAPRAENSSTGLAGLRVSKGSAAAAATDEAERPAAASA